MLPDSVVPVHYDLVISPAADALAFKGSVGIDIDVLTPSSQITLNEKESRWGLAIRSNQRFEQSVLPEIDRWLAAH